MKRRTYKKEVIQDAVSNSKTFSDVFKCLGLKVNGGSYKWIRKKISDYDIDISHFMTKEERMVRMTELSNAKKGVNLYDVDDISNGQRLSSRKLQSFMKFKGVEHKCNVCGLDRWLDKPIRLDIDHIDGVCDNNHITNLQYICPNCHRQKTIEIGEEIERVKKKKIQSYMKEVKIGKNNKCLDCETIIVPSASRCVDCFNKTKFKIVWPSDSELSTMVWETPTVELSKRLGVSDIAITKRCNKLGISKPPRGYWSKIGSPGGNRNHVSPL